MRNIGMPEDAIDILNVYWTYIGADYSKMSFVHQAWMFYMYAKCEPTINRGNAHAMSVACTERLRELGGEIWLNTKALKLLMATLKKPHLLLLDEHTAALDPKTAKTVLEITDKIVTENNLTTLMITHNMKAALRHGNRIIMMHEGHVTLRGQIQIYIILLSLKC